MTFAKGHSGNPGGKSQKTPEMREAERLARVNSPAAIRKLVGLMDSEDERVVFMASNAILDRALGKPSQDVTLHDERRPLRELTDAELAAELAATEAELAALGMGTPPDPPRLN